MRWCIYRASSTVQMQVLAAWTKIRVILYDARDACFGFGSLLQHEAGGDASHQGNPVRDGERTVLNHQLASRSARGA